MKNTFIFLFSTLLVASAAGTKSKISLCNVENISAESNIKLARIEYTQSANNAKDDKNGDRKVQSPTIQMQITPYLTRDAIRID